MSNLTVFVAPPSQRDILAAMVDLVQAEVVSGFGWIEAAPDPSAAKDHLDPQVVLVGAEGMGVSTMARQTSRHGIDVIRVLVVVPVGLQHSDALSGVAEEFFRQIQMPKGVKVEYIRVLVPYSAEGSTESLGRVGWHDIMLSPESTSDPSFAAVAWWSDLASMAGSAAVGLAVHGGIVDSLESTPADGYLQDISEDVTVTRAFVRMTDGTEVEGDVRARVLEVGDELPGPRSTNGTLVRRFDDPYGVIRNVVVRWSRKHKGTLITSRLSVPQVEERRIGFLRAVREFFVFMWDAIKGAPAAWVTHLVHSAKAAIAGTTTSLLYGEGSGIRVVVDGVDSSGNAVDISTISETAERVAGAIVPLAGSTAPRGHRDLSGLWGDLVGAARSLVDASACEGLEIAAGQGFVANSRDIAPALGDQGSLAFGGRPGGPRSGRLDSWDQVKVDQTIRELEARALEGEVGSQEASSMLVRVQKWQTDNSRRFLPQIGVQLSSWFEEAQQQASSYAAELDDLTSAMVPPGVEKIQRSLGTRLRVLLIVFVTLFVAAGLMAWLCPWSVLVLAFVGGGLAVGWLLASFLTFVIGQREVFAFIHYQETADRRIPVVRENLRCALNDLSAIGRAYAQFGCWSRIITALLADPFGLRSQDPVKSELIGDLPKSVVRRKVSTDAATIADKSALLRARVYEVGWFTRAWEAAERSIGEYLTPDQKLRVLEGSVVLEQEPGVRGSILNRWSHGLEARGVRSEQGEALWQECVNRLKMDPSFDLVLRTVPVSAGVGGEQPRLISDVRADLEQAESASVVKDVLGPEARVANLHLVDHDRQWFRQVSRGLNETMILVQQTKPIRPEDFWMERSSSPSASVAMQSTDDGDRPSSQIKY